MRKVLLVHSWLGPPFNGPFLKGDFVYKVGDWVIHDLNIGQIQEMDGPRVTQFSDGSFECSSNDLKVRPLTLASKRASETMKYYENEIRKVQGQNGLNWPEIHGYFCHLCYEAIDDTKKYSEGEYKPAYKKAQDFVNRVRDSLDGVGVVDGVRLFRR